MSLIVMPNNVQSSINGQFHKNELKNTTTDATG